MEIKKYKRAFLFGCSFTDFHWPTWAEVLAYQADFPVINLGQSGIGNVAILHEILKCDIEYRFDESDLIIIMWSHWSREDRWLHGHWYTHGNVFKNKFYDSEFINRYWSWENDIIKNSTAIILANKSFNVTRNFSITDYGQKEYDIESRSQTNLLHFYQTSLPQLTLFDYSENSRFDGTSVDNHPDILCHVNFYNKNICSAFGLKPVDQDSIFHEVQESIKELLKNTKNWNQQYSLIKDHMKNRYGHVFTKYGA